MPMRTFKICGYVIDSKTKCGIKGLRVESWDKDLIVSDLVGGSTTGEGGIFRIQFDESYFKELFFDRRPDLFFKIFHGENLIKSTKDSVLWNVDREDIEITIEIENSEGTVDSEIEPGKNISTRSVLQATYTPRKSRQGEELSKVPRGLEKGVFLARLAFSKDEISNLASYYKNESNPTNTLDTTVIRKALKVLDVLTNTLSRTGKINVLQEGKQFIDLDSDALIRVANDLLEFRQETTTINQINRLRNLIHTFKKNLETIPIGYLHLERMSFTPAGIEHGELVYTVPLSPNEEVNVKHREWSRTSEEFERIVTDYLEDFSEEGVTEKTEIAQSVNSQTQHQQAFNMAVSVSGEAYGFTISSSVGYNASESATRSEQFTRNSSRELTSKASSRSKKEHKFSFRVASAQETEKETVQRIKNPFSDRALRIDYYQLIRKWHVGLYRYGIRLTWDIVITEPGAGVLSKIIEISNLRNVLDQQYEFPLTPDEISLDPSNENYYVNKAEEYGVSIPELPPSLYTSVADAIEVECQEDFTRLIIKIEVPENYIVRAAHLGARFEPDKDRNWTIWIHDMTGTLKGIFYTKKAENPDWSGWATISDPYEPWNHKSGPLNIRVGCWAFIDGAVSYELELVLKDDIIKTWQLKIWEMIRESHYANFLENKRIIRERLERLQEELGSQDALSLRKKEREEVMKSALEELGISPEEHREDWAIKFIHHAIEWENMLYFLYPYFWSDKGEEGQYWEFKKYLDHPDPMHKAFLKAGAARVVLTIRPGFENAFMAYVQNPSMLPGELPSAPYLEIGKEFEAYANTNYPGIPPANPVENFRPLLTYNQKKAWSIMQLHIRLVEVFYRTMGRYPSTNEGLSIIRQIFPIKDPWNNDYIYVSPGQHGQYDLASYGADNAPGGSGESADITSWDDSPMMRETPKQIQAWEDLQLMSLLLEEHCRIHGRFPTTAEGLQKLKEIIPLKDPWLRDYVYFSPGEHADYELISYGADGVPGGDGENTDIASWAEASLIGEWYEYTPTSALDIRINESLIQS
jgi:type II secretory pathway pseudopilin PulG